MVISRARVLRATAVTFFVAMALAAGAIFVAFPSSRVKAVERSMRSEQGALELPLSNSPQLRQLSHPFALIARVTTGADATLTFIVDDAARCERRVGGGESARIDCVVEGPIAAGPNHTVRIVGPAAPWTLDYLELATHHGNTTGLMNSFVLPAASTNYTGPSAPIVLLVSLIVLALQLLPTPAIPRSFLLTVHRVVVGLMAAILVLALVSPYVSPYRVVISLGTLVQWLALFFAPQFLVAGRRAIETRFREGNALAWRPGVIALFALLGWCAFRDLSYAQDLIAAARMGGLVGWDLLPTCNGLATFAAGKDPYVLENLNNAAGPASWMTFPYPITAAYPAKVLCLAQGVAPNAHIGVYLVILAGSCAALAYSLWRSAVEVAWVTLAAISAFCAYRWLALTGNIAIFEVPFAALAVAALHRRRYTWSGVAFGLMSSLKVLPLAGALAFLVLPIEWPKRLRAVAAAGLAFAAFHVFNAAISRPYASGFWAASFGQIPGQPGLAGEPGGLNNPNFIDFVFAIFGTLGLGATTPVVSAIAFCGMAAGATVVLLAQRTTDTDEGTVRLFGFAVLVITLFLFRLKPYAYGALVPFAIAAVAFPNRAMRGLGYLLLAAVPALFAGRSMDAAVVYPYFQTVSLLAFLAAAAGLNGYWLSPRRRGVADLAPYVSEGGQEANIERMC